MRRSSLGVFLALVGATVACPQTIAPAGGPTPNLVSNIERPLRYQPDGHDFVIENGGEFFNRPLYGRNTAFRVDAGDVPEFLLYLPGRGGNLRLGLHAPGGSKWLHDAKSVVARYRPGQMLYEVRDPLLGPDAVLRIAAVPMHETDGLFVRFDGERIDRYTTVLFAFGGVNGQRGRRDGDIGTERVPIGEYFQLRPEVCRDDRIEVSDGRFVVFGKTATIVGSIPAESTRGIGSSAVWADPVALLESQRPGAADPVVTGDFHLPDGTPRYIALQRVNGVTAPATAEELATYREVTAPRPGATSLPAIPLRAAYLPNEIPAALAAAEAHYAKVRTRVAVETPDPFINAAVAALNIAADAVWDEPQQGIMHGAIAWRSRLLGWRGPYAMDALGWHERARAHFRYWATRQNTDPIPEKLPPPDENANLARSEAALHSNGDMSNSHYDMNLVAIDALFRHLRWTGDLEFAREMWPVIERHLAWERRLFRREFTTASGEALPLYEAYAAIWASDDLQYSGGGTAHASAYNFFHNQEAACLARLLGHDAAPFEREAELIARGMRELLWVPDQGTFAETKDLLGRQLVHPSAALWSVYHVIDSEVPTPMEALQMTRYVERELPRLPIAGPGVPADGSHAVYASSSWMPYTWSINNVVMGENIHTALAFWQVGRIPEAYRLTRSALLASMYMGICPGNVGSMNYLDVYRRESQRDFADGSGVLARAIVEGLFGVHRDALSGHLRLRPGLPPEWTRASLVHPDVAMSIARDGERESITVSQRGLGALPVRVEWPMRAWKVKVQAAGESLPVDVITNAWGARLIVFELPATFAGEATIEWSDRPDSGPTNPRWGENNPAPTEKLSASHDWKSQFAPAELYSRIDLTPHFNDRVTEIFRPGKYRSPRSPFVSLALPSQGIGAWAGHVNEMAEIDDAGLRGISDASGGVLKLPNGVPFATPGPGTAPNVLFVSRWDNYPDEATIPLDGTGRAVFLLMAGSTNAMQSRLDNGEVIVTYEDGTTTRLALRNPETWWPIDQDYFVDDYQFAIQGGLPPRVDLRTGEVRLLDPVTFKGRGGKVPGGAATVLPIWLEPRKPLRSLTVRALANDVVIGLMAATVAR